QAPLSPRGPLEVLHYVGHVDELPIDARLLQRAVEQLARRAYERPAGLVLLISRLLAEEDRSRGFQALAEDGLRAGLVEVAGGAVRCGCEQARQRELSARNGSRDRQLGVRHAVKVHTVAR